MIQKYRAWHKKKKRMRLVEMIEFDSQRVLTRRERRIGNISHDIWYFKDIILMQSIGKEDNNSKEIFDGDIIENEEQIAVVKKDFCFGLDWAIKNKKPGWYCTCEDAFENCKIIGNKFENPEYSTPILKKEARK